MIDDDPSKHIDLSKFAGSIADGAIARFVRTMKGQ